MARKCAVYWCRTSIVARYTDKCCLWHGRGPSFPSDPISIRPSGAIMLARSRISQVCPSWSPAPLAPSLWPQVRHVRTHVVWPRGVTATSSCRTSRRATTTAWRRTATKRRSRCVPSEASPSCRELREMDARESHRPLHCIEFAKQVGVGRGRKGLLEGFGGDSSARPTSRTTWSLLRSSTSPSERIS